MEITSGREDRPQNTGIFNALSLPGEAKRGFPIVERMSRGCVPSLTSVFKGSAHAIRELVDNAINYRGAQTVEIDVRVGVDAIIVQNIGGRGMSAEHIANWVSWGDGECHGAEEISQYRVGGKAAVSYLGAGFRLWSRLSGEGDHWYLEDSDFSTRPNLRDYGEIWPLQPELVPAELRTVPIDRGYVRIEIIQPNARLRLDQAVISRDIAGTYKPLLDAGEVVITVNGVRVVPSDASLDDDVPKVPIDVRLDGVVALGWAAKLGRAPDQPKPGFSLYSKSRRIREGEWFSQNPFAKGALSSFHGELSISGLTLNVDKSDYVERGTATWLELGRAVLEQASPVLNELRGQGSTVRITEHDRKTARQVREELEALLEDGSGEGEETVVVQELVVQVRERPRQKRVRKHHPGSGRGRVVTFIEREPDYVLVEREVPVGGFPEVVIESWDAPVRSVTRVTNGCKQVIVNKQHPAYTLANARFIIAECILAEVLGSKHTETAEYKDRIDNLLAEWAERSFDRSNE